MNSSKQSKIKINSPILAGSNSDNNNINSSVIDIESNCCSFTNQQRNTRRIVINVSLFLMNLLMLAGIGILIFKSK